MKARGTRKGYTGNCDAGERRKNKETKKQQKQDRDPDNGSTSPLGEAEPWICLFINDDRVAQDDPSVNRDRTGYSLWDEVIFGGLTVVLVLTKWH